MGLFDRLKRTPETSREGEAGREAESEPSDRAAAPETRADAPEHGAPEHGSPEHGSPEQGSPEQGSPEQGSPEQGRSAPGAAAGQRGGWFANLRQGLKKTADLLNTDIRDLFKKEGRLVDDEFLKELFAILIKTDMGARPASEIRDRVKRDFRGRVVQMDDVLLSVREGIRELMQQPERPLELAAEGPTVILVVGVNGSGKTTSIAKLANRLRQEGKSVVLGAGDTFRAAAVEQLTIWAERIGAEIIKGPQGGDPAAVAHQTVSRALESGADVCILDTAGRLQTQTNLMKQLEKIRRVVGKLIPDAPHEVLLVLDATAGQNGISQARGFSDAAGCTGIVLAKLDGTAKGGVVIPIRQQFNLPVKFIGVGEKASDLEEFHVDRFVEALFPRQTPG